MAQATAQKLIALEGATFTMKEKHLMMGGSDEVIDIPVPTFLVEHAKGLVLFDTGCAPEVATDPEGYWQPSTKFLRNIRFQQRSNRRSAGQTARLPAGRRQVCSGFASAS